MGHAAEPVHIGQWEGPDLCRCGKPTHPCYWPRCEDCYADVADRVHGKGFPTMQELRLGKASRKLHNGSEM